jgi:hypothetical protein
MKVTVFWDVTTCSLVDNYPPTSKKEAADTYETSVFMHKATKSHSSEASKKSPVIV